MIKFFRKIRQNQISKGKVINYFLYAFGEIILVVIGILIALGFNNNNEAKKIRDYELKMLSEVRQELIQDTTYFTMLSSRAEISSNSLKKVIALSNRPTQNIDGMNQFARGFIIGLQYSYHKGAYESIKSVGLDRIANDSIRLLMTNVYDFILTRNEKLILQAQERATQAFEERAPKIFTFSFEKGRNDEYIPVVKFQDKNWKDNQDLAFLALTKLLWAENAVSRLQDVKQGCTLLINLINQELESSGRI